MIERLTVRDLQEFREVDASTMSLEEFDEKLKVLGKQHNLTVEEAVQAHSIARRLLPAPNQWI